MRLLIPVRLDAKITVMARSEKRSRRQNKSVVHRLTVPTAKAKQMETPQSLLTRATELLHTSQPDEAVALGERALATLQNSSKTGSLATLPALTLLGGAYLELGDIATARNYFARAINVDPEGSASDDVGGGAEKFLWLAQLCEEGGKESVDWYERGITILRRQLQELENNDLSKNTQLVGDVRDKLAKALCGIAEVYMTDLSWEEDAESKCEAVVTEALLVSPNSPEPLQTLASIRISQTRIEDAKAALRRSIELWKDLPPEDAKVPDFPTRISLARLLLEAEMEENALKVLERLISDDDQSVEAWYLGGWALYLLGQKAKGKSKGQDDAEDGPEWEAMWRSSREWLEHSLQLCSVLEYEDDRLRDHAQELVAELSQVVEVQPAEENDGEALDEEEWVDDDGASDVDETMTDT